MRKLAIDFICMHSTVDIVSNISSVTDNFNAVLLDAYGVFWGGNEIGLLPGAKEKMESLIRDGKIVGILSNTTQLVDKEIHKFHHHGLIQGTHFHFVITSGEITRKILLEKQLPFHTPNNKFWLFGDVHPKFSSHEAIFKETVYKETTNIKEADFIYISIPHINGEDQIDPKVFFEKIKIIAENKLPMVCANPDQFAHEGKPPQFVVRQGSIAKMYAELGGPVYYIGKPDQRCYHYALELFRQYHIGNPAGILMIGDTPETDIRGALRAGMKAALVMHTGMMAERIAKVRIPPPFSLQKEETPHYYFARFA